MVGNIASIDPMSFNSGPGIRVAIKMTNDDSLKLTPMETVDRIRKFRPYFGPNGGGVTFIDPDFKQSDYLKETCHICHKAGINTCIQTTGIGYQEDSDLLSEVDLFILNIVGLPLDNYNNLSIDDLMSINKFMNLLAENNKKIWVKQTITKNLNDHDNYIYKLKKYLRMYDNIQDVEIIADGLTEKEVEKIERILSEGS